VWHFDTELTESQITSGLKCGASLADIYDLWLLIESDIPHILDVYFKKLGGRDKVLNDFREKRERASTYSRKKCTARVWGSDV
jgi:hypothetical protein